MIQLIRMTAGLVVCDHRNIIVFTLTFLLTDNIQMYHVPVC